ncbi:MAG: PEP-CTERM sorting domain-containing protein [Pseudomonadota bacterium]
MTIKSVLFAGICLSCPIAQATILTNPPISPDDLAHWATTVVDFSPGPQDINVIGSPTASQGLPINALGPRNNGTVSLGDGGSITLAFDSPFSNSDGADFAVFENAFGFNGLIFAELGFVSVSSNGADFATFPIIFDDPELDDSFGSPFRLIDVDQTNNFAGVHSAPNGTGFDLSDLLSDSAVTSGLVDLDSILFIRITDAVGDGSTFDSLGNAIFDPYPTDLGAGGFDLDAVGTVAPVPVPPALVLLLSVLLPLNRLRR